MIQRFSEAVVLLANNLRLFSAIILTVWLPGNILVNYVVYHTDVAGAPSMVRLTTSIEGIFGPIYIGALTYALYQLKSGRTVTYREAMAVGFRRWGSLFAARLQGGLMIFFGLLAFVIPGVLLAVRYSLTDAAVIIDRREGSDALKRSVRLTEGLRWQVFFSAIVFFPILTILSFGIYVPLAFVEFDTMPIEIALDCLLDIVYAVIQIVVFLFYWEATQDQRRTETTDEPEGNAAGEFALPEFSGDDGNPYRAPLSG